MRSPRFWSPLPRHLRAFLVASFCAGGLLIFGVSGAMWMEARSIRSIASEASRLKNQGTVLQGAAFAAKDVLPLYGSSELLKHVPDRASEFFAHHPADFAVSPTGRAGSTSLILLQKIAASAGSVRGHKVAIILSPSWFLVPAAPAHTYEGNFSVIQANKLVFGSSLSPALKQDIARRLLDYPQTLQKSPLLEFAVRRLVGGQFSDRVLYAATWPLGRLESAIFAMQDHCTAGLRILMDRHRSAKNPAGAEPLPWPQLLAEAASQVFRDVAAKPDTRPHWFADDADFLSTLQKAREWQDLELLLRTLSELHFDALIISIPLERRRFEHMGLSAESIAAYDQRLHSLAEHYRMPVADFADHEDDAKFFADHHDHLSIKGWMYFDKALDDFYHAPPRHLHPRRAPDPAADKAVRG